MAKNSGPTLYFSQFGGEQPIPPEFIAAMERKEERTKVDNDVTAEALSDTIIDSKVITDQRNERTLITVKKKAGNITLSAIRTNDQGQPVQVTRTLYPTGTTPTAPTATTSVAVHDLGNGWSIQEVGVEGTYIAGTFTPGVFDEGRKSVEIPDVTPAWAKALISTHSDSSVAAGTSISTPTLSTGQFKKELVRETDKKVRTTVVSQDSLSLPKTRTNKALTTEFGGGLVDDVQTIATGTQTPSSGGLLVLGSEVEVLGDGTSALKTRTMEGSEWPELLGTEFDTRFGILYHIRKQVVDAETVGAVDEFTVREVQPVDKWRSIQLTGYLIELPSDQVWYGTRNHSFPDTLTSFSLTGTEELGYTYALDDGYSGPVRARFTRAFSTGAPVDTPEPTIFQPQSYNTFVEYTLARTADHTSSGTNTSTGTHTSSGSQNNTNTGTHDEQGTSESQGSSTGQHTSNETSSSSGSENTTKSTSKSGSVSTSASTSSSGTDTFSGGSSERLIGEDTTIESDSGDSSYSKTSFIVENSASSQGANSNSTHNVESTDSSSHDGTSATTSSGTRTTESSGSGTNNNTSSNTHSGSTTTSSVTQSQSDGQTTSTGSEETTSTGTTVSTGKSHIQVSIPKSLHAALSSTLLGCTVSIPATSPTALPSGDWIIIDSQAEHWRFGVWVRETIEILVP